MADDSRSRGFAAKEQKLQAKLDNLQSRYGKAKELLDKTWRYGQTTYGGN
jgi:hypothetical protein